MLARLSIRDVVLIDQLDLEFSTGLTILTGETGAGKSILLDALSLALGARGDGGLVRHGQPQGQVTAVFELPAGHAAHALLEGQDIEIGDELILRRIQVADGRTRAYVNDQSVSVQALRALASSLVEIHGQHDERALTDPATHRALVDSYGGLEDEVRATRDACAAMREAERALEDERALVAAAEAEADFARHAHEELKIIGVQPGEEDELAARRQSMMQGEKVAADIREARDHLTGDAAILPMLLSVSRRLQRRASQAPTLIEPSVRALDEAIDAVEGATRAVEEALEAGRNEAARLEAELARARAAYHAAARALSAARGRSARDLEKAVTAELPPLKLDRAEFRVELTTDEGLAAPSGYDRAEFLVRTNPGSRPGPLMKVASGGELSRFLLAIKVRLAERGTAPTLVFDEIDAGVGGAVADAMGQRLARLAARAQVLAVTHAPQVAARARIHYRIVKSDVGRGERVVISVDRLDAGERREEIARMLAGAQITREARAAAASLIEKAG